MQSTINGGGLTASSDGTSFSASGLHDTGSQTGYGISEDVTWSDSNRGVKNITATGMVHLANRPDKGDSASEMVTIPAGELDLLQPDGTPYPRANRSTFGGDVPLNSDLVPLVLHTSGQGGRYQLEFTDSGPSQYIKIWAKADKSAADGSTHIVNAGSGPTYRIGSDSTIIDASVDTTVYVEGVQLTGNYRDSINCDGKPIRRLPRTMFPMLRMSTSIRRQLSIR